MAKVKGIQELINLGRDLKVEEDDLLAFAERERKLDMELIDAERAERQADRESQNLLRQMELKAAERDAERASSRELELARINGEIELELVRLNAQLNTSPNPSPAAFPLDAPRAPVKPPQIPKFDERVDDLDSYITRFERHAVTVGWSQNDWATYLLSLLTGRAQPLCNTKPR